MYNYINNMRIYVYMYNNIMCFFIYIYIYILYIYIYIWIWILEMGLIGIHPINGHKWRDVGWQLVTLWSSNMAEKSSNEMVIELNGYFPD